MVNCHLLYVVPACVSSCWPCVLICKCRMVQRSLGSTLCNTQDSQRADIPLPETKGTQNKEYVKEHCTSVQQFDYSYQKTGWNGQILFALRGYCAQETNTMSLWYYILDVLALPMALLYYLSFFKSNMVILVALKSPNPQSILVIGPQRYILWNPLKYWNTSGVSKTGIMLKHIKFSYLKIIKINP